MIRIKESGKEYVYLFYFHSSCQDYSPKYPENHRKKVSHLVLQEIGYKKASASQMINCLIPAKKV